MRGGSIGYALYPSTVSAVQFRCIQTSKPMPLFPVCHKKKCFIILINQQRILVLKDIISITSCHAELVWLFFWISDYHRKCRRRDFEFTESMRMEVWRERMFCNGSRSGIRVWITLEKLLPTEEFQVQPLHFDFYILKSINLIQCSYALCGNCTKLHMKSDQ